MPVVSFALAVIFIIRLFSTSVFRVPNLAIVPHVPVTVSSRTGTGPRPGGCRLCSSWHWKKFCSFWFGVFSKWRHHGACFRDFLAKFTWPWAPRPWGIFLDQVCFGNSASIRVFWALDWLSSISGAKIMAQNTKIGKNFYPHKHNFGCFTPIFYMAVTRQQLELESSLS